MIIRILASASRDLVDGYGRAAGALSILMALQAGLPLLNFSPIAEEKKQEYFAAVQAGLERNYAPMERLYSEIIKRSLASLCAIRIFCPISAFWQLTQPERRFRWPWNW